MRRKKRGENEEDLYIKMYYNFFLSEYKNFFNAKFKNAKK